MIVFLNGAFIPEEAATVSVFDRGFVYGDGLFETIRLYRGRPFRWDDHGARLQRGAEFLGIRLPFSPHQLRSSVEELVHRNKLTEASLRIVLSRGVGPRGYSTQGADCPTLVMSLHSAPTTRPSPLHWRLITASPRIVPNDPLSRHKTCNKLPNILARAEADARDADEALLLNTRGEVAEATGANLFWIDGQTVFTPLLDSGALPGITRAVVIGICGGLSIPCLERPLQPELLRNAEGVFLTSSGVEVVEALSLDGYPLRRSELTARVHQAYRSLVSELDPKFIV
ncbi:MAG: hypothetical protein FJ398_24810 [Verrucomicrobia bacterium]|nr:hypothetical protein [Verrucomicrobiota bacterium]